MRGAHVEWADLDGEVVVFHERTGRVRTLNATAGLVWRFLDGTVTVADLAGDLAAELGVDPEQARADLTRLVGTLRRAGLLEP